MTPPQVNSATAVHVMMEHSVVGVCVTPLIPKASSAYARCMLNTASAIADVIAIGTKAQRMMIATKR